MYDFFRANPGSMAEQVKCSVRVGDEYHIFRSVLNTTGTIGLTFHAVVMEGILAGQPVPPQVLARIRDA
jgi:hypothetical protein